MRRVRRRRRLWLCSDGVGCRRLVLAGWGGGWFRRDRADLRGQRKGAWPLGSYAEMSCVHVERGAFCLACAKPSSYVPDTPMQLSHWRAFTPGGLVMLRPCMRSGRCKRADACWGQWAARPNVGL